MSNLLVKEFPSGLLWHAREAAARSRVTLRVWVIQAIEAYLGLGVDSLRKVVEK